MNLQKLLAALLIATTVVGCNSSKEEDGKFTLEANLANIPDQQVYLEQLYFSQQQPQVLDTAEVKNGKFKVSSTATENGLYRIRFEKANSGYIFINDQPKIKLKADLADASLEGPDFNSPANKALKNLLLNIEGQRKTLVSAGQAIDSLKKNAGNDSIISSEIAKLAVINDKFSKFILGYIDTVSQPVIAMFALGYTQSIDPAILKTVIPNLAKRFPNHQGVAGIVSQYNDMLTQKTQPQPQPQTTAPGVGTVAPDFTMNDTEGKPFKLSQLKGKYVLVDFWASWCGPCRGENPNVVAAYNKYKNKNFTILGVSLDDNKEKWLQAIQTDNLAWKQVSDLKGWENATVKLFGYDGIPYNILLDPQGKILATSLRESALQAKLAEVLQ